MRALLSDLGVVRAACILTLTLGLASLVFAETVPEASAPLLPRAPATAPAMAPREGMVAREGTASWYGPQFHGRMTACGETFDQDGLTAAHRTLPFGTLLAVTNLDTGCSVMLRVNDRGPYHGDRILDCSRAGAQELGFIDDGVARIRWEIIDPSTVAGAPGLSGISAKHGGLDARSLRALHSRSQHAVEAEPPRPMNTEEASW